MVYHYHFGASGAFKSKDLDDYKRKLKQLSFKIMQAKKEGPKAAAEEIVINAKRMSPHRTGKMRDNIFAIKDGDLWVVQSTRLGETDEIKIHSWVNMDIPLRGMMYSECPNKTGTPGYWDNAIYQSRNTSIRTARKYVGDALKIKIG